MSALNKRRLIPVSRHILPTACSIKAESAARPSRIPCASLLPPSLSFQQASLTPHHIHALCSSQTGLIVAQTCLVLFCPLAWDFSPSRATFPPQCPLVEISPCHSSRMTRCALSLLKIAGHFWASFLAQPSDLQPGEARTIHPSPSRALSSCRDSHNKC